METKRERITECYLLGLTKDECHEKIGGSRVYISNIYEDLTFERAKQMIQTKKERLMQIGAIEDKLFELIERETYDKNKVLKDKINQLQLIYQTITL
jgi:hypothetical protein